MKKVKYIMNPSLLSRLVMVLAIVLSLVAIFTVVLYQHGPRTSTKEPAECKTMVVVASGDTLGKILIDQGLNNSDVNAIADALKKNAGISTLRADSDKFEFTRPDTNSPVSKIVLIPSPWKQV